ncbi:ROK family transcriptional regulator [Curvibacter cyanobacteriorum]|uniref:ROK family transcriptional regulator n=1 Tax=Curvibacter cyanobacteriorum TaxID=3026422 RepID=UPI0039084579
MATSSSKKASLEKPLSPDTATTSPRLRPRGSSQGGLRQYNERVVLQAVRLHGALPGAELARLTHLTAQTVSLITKRLIEDGLLLKQAPLRGKVGQPSVPLGLNPEGAWSVGVKVGRRRLDVLLIDFEGQVRERASTDHAYPDPEQVLNQVCQQVEAFKQRLGPAAAERLQGVGVAAPLSLGGWQPLLGYPADLAQRWERTDLRLALEQRCGLPATTLKDTAAACVAELVAGRGRSLKSFLYVFVDTFIGGGLVIDSHLRAGLHGNAGAIGSLPLGLAPSGPGGRDAPAQLLSVASLVQLEQRFQAAGLDPRAASDARALQAPWQPHTEAWLQAAGTAIALASNSASCLLDLDGVILDGAFDRALLDALLTHTERALDRYSWEGVARPQLLAGTIGSDAGALGGALLPLYANFAPAPDLFLKVAN